MTCVCMCVCFYFIFYFLFLPRGHSRAFEIKGHFTLNDHIFVALSASVQARNTRHDFGVGAW